MWRDDYTCRQCGRQGARVEFSRSMRGKDTTDPERQAWRKRLGDLNQTHISLEDNEMTKSQTLQIEQSKLREDINASLAKDGELEDAERAELAKLTTRAQNLEGELRAAILIDGEQVPEERETVDGEEREYRELLGKASLGELFEAVIDHAQPSGATAELQQADKSGQQPCAAFHAYRRPIPSRDARRDERFAIRSADSSGSFSK